MKFNDIIRSAMRDTDTTQVQLGDKLGIGQTAVANTIARPGISLAKFVTIMNALGYDVTVQPRNNPASPITITNEPQSHLD